MKRCTSLTKSGHNCQAWAMHGHDLCAVHAKRNVNAGAPAGNQNALKHGFYRSVLTAQELADLVAHADNETVDDEIALTRVLLRRLMTRLQQPDIELDELKAISPLIFTGSRTIANLLRSKKPGTGLTDTINDVLDELEARYPIL